MLDIRSLTVRFGRPDGVLQALDGVSLRLSRGETLGVVGESGSGKSMLALAAMGLLPPRAKAGGEVLIDGRDMLRLPERERCMLRGRRIGMIFQEPMTALNPAMTVGAQITEGIRLHTKATRREARAEALRLLDRVRIPEAASRLDSYPHELSGGQRQRVGIAIALAPRPDLLIADEPTTALDTVVQRDILDLLAELLDERALALVLVSHDLAVVAELADRMLVLHRGRVVEEGPTRQVLLDPTAEHTRELLAALPRRARAGLDRLRENAS